MLWETGVWGSRWQPIGSSGKLLYVYITVIVITIIIISTIIITITIVIISSSINNIISTIIIIIIITSINSIITIINTTIVTTPSSLPLLFIVFINDLPAAIKHSIVDIYADDTTLSSSADIEVTPQAISENLQKDLEETRVWSIKNKMVLSDSKTKCMLVTGKRLESKFSDNCSLHLKLNGTEIKQVNSQKLLGVTIDNKLSFDDHIERLCKKLTQKNAVLRKIRRFLPLEERKLYYNAIYCK